MGFAKRFMKLSTRLVLGTVGLFIDKVKSEEAHVMLEELKKIDHKLKNKLTNTLEAKKDFIHLFHKLEATTKRLIERGEKFEAQHIHHVYVKYAQVFDDQKIFTRLKKIHP